MKRKFLIALLSSVSALACAFIFVACGGGGNGGLDAPNDIAW